MTLLTLNLSDLTFNRLKALAVAREVTIEALLLDHLNDFAGSQSTRRAIRQVRTGSLADLGWLDGYEGQAIDELLAFTGKEDTVVLLQTIEQAIQAKLSQNPMSVNGVEATILALMALEREVNDGGFDQFFRNSSGRYAFGITDCVVRIGCKETTKVVRRAVKALGLRDWSVKGLQEKMATDNLRRETTWQACDEAFWKLTEIPDLLLSYVIENAKQNPDCIASTRDPTTS